jgi:hypothetical protein
MLTALEKQQMSALIEQKGHLQTKVDALQAEIYKIQYAPMQRARELFDTKKVISLPLIEEMTNNLSNGHYLKSWQNILLAYKNGLLEFRNAEEANFFSKHSQNLTASLKKPKDGVYLGIASLHSTKKLYIINSFEYKLDWRFRCFSDFVLVEIVVNCGKIQTVVQLHSINDAIETIL